MNAPCDLDWSTANQRLLVAEFARLRRLLGDADATPDAAAIESARGRMPGAAAIDSLASLFALSNFERDVLLLAAGVEMDARLAALCAAHGPAGSVAGASFGLALAVLPDAHWSALTPVAPLRRQRLVGIDEQDGLTGSRLRIDERVLHYIGGLNYLDHRLQAMLHPVATPTLLAEVHRRGADAIVARMRDGSAAPRPVLLHGDDADGQRDLAATVAAELGLALYRLRGADLPGTAHEQDALATLWRREAALLGAGLLIEMADDDGSAVLAAMLARIDGPVLVSCRQLPAIALASEALAVDRPQAPEQRALWRTALGERAAAMAPTIDTLAGQYRLSARRVAELAAGIGADPTTGEHGRLLGACRHAEARIGDLARAVESRAGWNDLVLPDAQRDMLRQMAVHVRQRLTVLYDWGFADRGSRGLGLASLFWGDSGTGKTLAAEVLATELDLALFRIDLSSVVSKYIGETEKNLRRVFDGAEALGAILLFDEADALFGKRSEVKDSHDRYANIEVSYLLQRMESYQGLAILTTNHRQALDNAFSRRLRFVVHFPFPDARQREAIWRTVFPADTPLAGIDFARLGNLAVAGGTIRNIALSAAFLAADAGTAVSMPLLRRAAHLEAAKRDKPFSDAETRGWT